MAGHPLEVRRGGIQIEDDDGVVAEGIEPQELAPARHRRLRGDPTGEEIVEEVAPDALFGLVDRLTLGDLQGAYRGGAARGHPVNLIEFVVVADDREEAHRGVAGDDGGDEARPARTRERATAHRRRRARKRLADEPLEGRSGIAQRRDQFFAADRPARRTVVHLEVAVRVFEGDGFGGDLGEGLDDRLDATILYGLLRKLAEDLDAALLELGVAVYDETNDRLLDLSEARVRRQRQQGRADRVGERLGARGHRARDRERGDAATGERLQNRGEQGVRRLALRRQGRQRELTGLETLERGKVEVDQPCPGDGVLQTGVAADDGRPLGKGQAQHVAHGDRWALAHGRLVETVAGEKIQAKRSVHGPRRRRSVSRNYSRESGSQSEPGRPRDVTPGRSRRGLAAARRRA